MARPPIVEVYLDDKLSNEEVKEIVDSISDVFTSSKREKQKGEPHGTTPSCTDNV